MNTKIIQFANIAFLALSPFCAGQSDSAFSTNVKVYISDDDKKPVDGADVFIAYAHLVDGRKDRTYRGKSDITGKFEADDRVNGCVLVRVSKENYYPLLVEDVIIRTDVERKKIKNVDLPLIMRRVKSPVSLYAKKVSLPIPKPDQPIGFDFEAGDWVKPFGSGLFIDLSFSYRKKFIGYRFDEDRLGEMRDFSKESAAVNHEIWTEETFKHDAGKWIGSLSISFPNPKEGMALVDEAYCLYSWLRMPRFACETGYEPTWKREENSFSPRTTKVGVGYFLRTRVKLGEEGKIVSANYTKFTSDIQFDPRGRIEFTYVFNPSPNDRNLEFNPGANLFKNQKVDERVMFP